MKRLSMKKLLVPVLSLGLLVMFQTSVSGKGRKKQDDINKSLKAKAYVDIRLLSGDVVIRGGAKDEVLVSITNTYAPANAFVPEVLENDTAIVLRDKYTQSSVRGKCTWTITVPARTKIRFGTSSGNLSIVDFDGEVAAVTSSGDLKVERSAGTFSLTTADGNMAGVGVSGDLRVNTASGNIKVEGSESRLDLSASNGDVNVNLRKSPSRDISLYTANGRAVLSLGETPTQGLYELSALKNKGKVMSLLPFDRTDEYSESGATYVKSSFKRGEAVPKISIKVNYGTARLKS